MCFFDQYRFTCGDWKWGQFRQHCAKEWRNGETCGMKLIKQTVPTGTKCKLCEKIDTKTRRRAAEANRLCRWQREPQKFGVSIEKSIDKIKELDDEINELQCERNRRLERAGIPIAGPSMCSRVIKERPEQNPKSNPGDKHLKQEEQIIEPEIKHINERFEMKKKKNIFLGLPITFMMATGPTTVMAVPDSGSDHNVISLDLGCTSWTGTTLHNRARPSIESCRWNHNRDQGNHFLFLQIRKNI